MTREPDRVEWVPGQLPLPTGGPRILSLFSGYGGLDLAALSVLGGEVVAHAEVDPAACRVLAHRFPDVPNLGDVTGVDWCADVGPVDVILGGFPCQDVSLAGRRLGIAAGTRSGLWAHMAGAVDELRPALVVIENVRGLLSARAQHPAHDLLEPCAWCVGDAAGVPLRALGAVLGDLADLGYDAAWRVLSAADVGAPHGRARVFVVAWPQAGDADGVDRDGWPAAGLAREARPTARCGAELVAAADPDRVGHERARQARDGRAGPADDRRRAAADAVRSGPYAAAVGRWAAVLGRDAPDPTDPTGRNGAHRLSARFVEWMMGLPAGWVTAVPGISRNDALHVLGNGVVWQQAAAAIAWLLQAVDAAAPPSEVDEGAA